MPDAGIRTRSAHGGIATSAASGGCATRLAAPPGNGRNTTFAATGGGSVPLRIASGWAIAGHGHCDLLPRFSMTDSAARTPSMVCRQRAVIARKAREHRRAACPAGSALWASASSCENPRKPQLPLSDVNGAEDPGQDPAVPGRFSKAMKSLSTRSRFSTLSLTNRQLG